MVARLGLSLYADQRFLYRWLKRANHLAPLRNRAMSGKELAMREALKK